MSKTKSITDLVTELQEENQSLQSLKKLFNQAVKNEFGFDVKTVHEKLTKLASIERKREEKKAQSELNDSNFNTSYSTSYNS